MPLQPLAFRVDLETPPISTARVALEAPSTSRPKESSILQLRVEQHDLVVQEFPGVASVPIPSNNNQDEMGTELKSQPSLGYSICYHVYF